MHTVYLHLFFINNKNKIKKTRKQTRLERLAGTQNDAKQTKLGAQVSKSGARKQIGCAQFYVVSSNQLMQTTIITR